jgi:hypothetical protein
MEEGLQLEEEKNMQEYSSRENCSGIMVVPITFLDKYNSEQFEIIGLDIANLDLLIGVRPYNEENKEYRK